MYLTAYHFQTDETFERTNQTFKIVFRYYIQTLANHKNWSSIIKVIQRTFNNETIFIEKTFNEMCYDFTSLQNTDLLKLFAKCDIFAQNTRITMTDNIFIIQMTIKRIYDEKHQSIQFKVEKWVLFRFHKNYKIHSTVVLKSKLCQQYVELFKILKKVDNLTYKLNISFNWNIWSVISVIQLKLFSFSIDNSFSKTFASLSSVTMKNESSKDDVRLYEVKKKLVKRNNLRKDIEYLIKWLDYDFENNLWQSLFELQNVMNLVNNFDFRTSNETRRERRKLKKYPAK